MYAIGNDCVGVGLQWRKWTRSRHEQCWSSHPPRRRRNQQVSTCSQGSLVLCLSHSFRTVVIEIWSRWCVFFLLCTPSAENRLYSTLPVVIKHRLVGEPEQNMFSRHPLFRQASVPMSSLQACKNEPRTLRGNLSPFSPVCFTLFFKNDSVWHICVAGQLYCYPRQLLLYLTCWDRFIILGPWLRQCSRRCLDVILVRFRAISKHAGQRAKVTRSRNCYAMLHAGVHSCSGSPRCRPSSVQSQQIDSSSARLVRRWQLTHLHGHRFLFSFTVSAVKIK